MCTHFKIVSKFVFFSDSENKKYMNFRLCIGSIVSDCFVEWPKSMFTGMVSKFSKTGKYVNCVAI